jgi:hypothetical protein
MNSVPPLPSPDVLSHASSELLLLSDSKHDFSSLLREAVGLLLLHGKQLFPSDIEELLSSDNDLEVISHSTLFVTSLRSASLPFYV